MGASYVKRRTINKEGIPSAIGLGIEGLLEFTTSSLSLVAIYTLLVGGRDFRVATIHLSLQFPAIRPRLGFKNDTFSIDEKFLTVTSWWKLPIRIRIFPDNTTVPRAKIPGAHERFSNTRYESSPPRRRFHAIFI